MEIAYLKSKVVLGKGFIEKQLGSCVDHVLIHDSSLAPCLQADLTLSIEASEKNKSRATKEMIEDFLLQHKCTRETTLIAQGGGVITDIVGFVAATYHRGIRYINVPTTLLGMVDAAIGGKTGVNTQFGKNTVGAFHLPVKTLCDIRFLDTLPNEEFLSGMAEVLKYGATIEREFFRFLTKNHLKMREDATLLHSIERCIAIKCRLVETDFTEKGMRKILNFGHTIGHALELLSGFTIPHGYAVAFGMLGEAYLSTLETGLAQQEFSFFKEGIEQYTFPRFSLKDVRYTDFYAALCSDKKRTKKAPEFVLLEEIGSVAKCGGQYTVSASLANILKTFEFMQCHTS